MGITAARNAGTEEIMDPITILASLLPLVIDGGKALISKVTGGTPPITSADDFIKIQDADVRRLEAIAKLDVPTGDVSRWVNDVRAMQRPTVVAIVLLAWVYTVATSGQHIDLVSNMASSVFFYLFGERGLMYVKKK